MKPYLALCLLTLVAVTACKPPEPTTSKTPPSTITFNTEGVELLDFYAEWCPPCKIQSPIIDTLEKEFANVTFHKIDVDQHPGIAESYDIKSIPTLVIRKDDKTVAILVGLQKESELRVQLEKALK
jgi:thioredoxin 1